MKLIFSIIFLALLNFQAISQERSERTMLLINTSHQENCTQAFRITEKTVAVDRCFDFNSGIFHPNKKVRFGSKHKLKELFNISTNNLEQYAKKLKAIDDCDTLYPIVIKIIDINGETIVKCRNIPEICLPESIKDIIGKLEDVSDKYK